MDFEIAYRSYVDSKKRLEASKRTSEFNEFLNSLDITRNSFLEAQRALGFDFESTIREELDSLIEGNLSSFQKRLNIEFVKRFYSEFDARVVFLINVIENQKPQNSIAVPLIELGKVILNKENWARIYNILELLAFFPNPKSVPLVALVLEKLKKANEYYHGELGHAIVHLLKVNNNKKSQELLEEIRHNEIGELAALVEGYDKSA
jgi:hypothetical protein